MNHAAQVARIGRSHPRPESAANEPRYPTYPQIKTTGDKFIALAVWAVGPMLVIGSVVAFIYFKR